MPSAGQSGLEHSPMPCSRVAVKAGYGKMSRVTAAVSPLGIKMKASVWLWGFLGDGEYAASRCESAVFFCFPFSSPSRDLFSGRGRLSILFLHPCTWHLASYAKTAASPDCRHCVQESVAETTSRDCWADFSRQWNIFGPMLRFEIA